MTVTSEVYRKDYTATGGTEFAFLYILDEAHVSVYVAGVLQTLATHYTVSDVGDPAGATITFLTAPTAGLAVALVRTVPYTQLTDFVESDRGLADTKEDVADKLTMLTQQLRERTDRTLMFATSSTSKNGVLPEPEVGKSLEWSLASPPTLRNVTTGVTGISVPVSTVNGGFGADVSANTGVPFFNPAGVATFAEPSWIGANNFRLVYSAGVLTLSAINGNLVDINGALKAVTVIPSLAATGTESGHVYYIYLSYAGVTPTLSFSETVPLADAVGRLCKTGDGGYRLMGAAYAYPANTWAPDALVTTSYNNRGLRTDVNAFTTARATSAAIWAEINSEIRVPFVAFAGDAVFSTIQGGHYGDVADNTVDGYIGVGLNGVVTISSAYDMQKIYYLTKRTFGVTNVDVIASDGIHYMTIVGGTNPAATQNEIMDTTTTLRVSAWG